MISVTWGIIAKSPYPRSISPFFSLFLPPNIEEYAEEEYHPILEVLVSEPSVAPSNPYHYVGGELFSANKLAILAPYLALIGIVAVAAIFAKRKLT
jgi:hypothetical protein